MFVVTTGLMMTVAMGTETSKVSVGRETVCATRGVANKIPETDSTRQRVTWSAEAPAELFWCFFSYYFALAITEKLRRVAGNGPRKNPETQAISHSFPKVCAALQKKMADGVEGEREESSTAILLRRPAFAGAATARHGLPSSVAAATRRCEGRQKSYIVTTPKAFASKELGRRIRLIAMADSELGGRRWRGTY